MQMTNQEYDAYIQKLSPKSPLWKDVVCAFVIGGLICTLGQVIQNGFSLDGGLLPEMLRFACAAGSLCATRFGGIPVESVSSRPQG